MSLTRKKTKTFLTTATRSSGEDHRSDRRTRERRVSMATIPAVQLNAIERKNLLKAAEHLHKATHCKI